MSEKQLSDQLTKLLHQNLKSYDYDIEQRKGLLYKIIIDSDGKISPDYERILKPKRGRGAFETDILISKKEKDALIPLVVLELKYKGLNSHDIITYSSKAVRHKEIYPYLRYGLVAAARNKIDRKFFTHNIGIDFALVFRGKESEKILIEMVKKQISVSEKMRRILSSKGVFMYEMDMNYY